MSTGAALGPEEREIISRELTREGTTTRSIGRLLGRSCSMVVKGVGRDGGREEYCAVVARVRCDASRARPKERRLESSRRLHDAVNDGLVEKRSPERVGRRLRAVDPDDPELRVSHETIYECLYLQGAG